MYVPPPTPPSAVARDLASKIDQVIRDYLLRHPNVSRTDVGQALQLAKEAHRVPGKRRELVFAAVAVAIAVLIAGIVSIQRGGANTAGTPAWLVAVSVLCGAAGLAIAIRRGTRR